MRPGPDMKPYVMDTNDRMIRDAVRSRLAALHAGQDAIIVDELKVSRGSSRMDVAVVNGRIEGYEIKSDKDTLDRLPRQVRMFGLVADRMTLVVGQRHLDRAAALVPDWWSILSPKWKSNQRMSLHPVRRGRLNPTRDKRALAEAMERDELVALLSRHAIDKGLRSAGYAVLVQRAVAELSRDQIGEHLKSMLKLRAHFASRYDTSAFGRNAIFCSPQVD